MKLVVRVPATSANLGPGFDAFGLALSLHNELELDTEAGPGVRWEGEGADELPTDGSDLISRAMRAAADEAGGSLPPVAMTGHNRIPLERGLGSSSAAAVAGVFAAKALLATEAQADVDLAEVFDLAARFEGHPDNAAPAVYGGFTIAYGSEGPPLRLEPHESLAPVVLIPEAVRLPTEEARRALPTEVAMSDAIFNAAHAAAVAVALTGGDRRLLIEGLADRLHQDARLALVPEVRVVFERMRDAGVPVCVSGAGPTLLAFESPDAVVPDPGDGWRAERLPVDLRGVHLADGDAG